MTGRRPQVPMAQRRAELVRVALQVMARDGAWAFTTRALALAANVPHGSVHYAFSSKNELIKAVLAADVASAAKIFARPVTSTPSKGEELAWAAEVLEAVFVDYGKTVLADPDTELALQELCLMGARDPELGTLVRESNEQYRDMMIGLLGVISQQVGRGCLPSQARLAEVSLCLCFGASQSWLVSRDDANFLAALRDAGNFVASQLRG